MPSIWSKNWSKIKEHWQWFLWGKRPYNELNDVKKQEARRDLYFRLFLIANAPAVANFYATFLLSISVENRVFKDFPS
ncbi:hypothetical protein CRE_18044 [Caenorhabditis remanei]|uniref:Anoctamin n=1 Tax=Caenorhabditis remanei TaxID=31234 RepID=E3MTY1_CAERE|nr:hypothetical protein CRE_18044 [Caenorhabditis remanei]